MALPALLVMFLFVVVVVVVVFVIWVGVHSFLKTWKGLVLQSFL